MDRLDECLDPDDLVALCTNDWRQRHSARSRSMSLEVSGLAPWTDGDSLQIAVGNNGAVVFSPELALAEPPAA